MTAKLAGVQVPSGATVDIQIHVTAPVNITAYVARQRVNAFVKMEISTQLRAEQPDLVVGDRLCWSVPVTLGFPDRGIVGKAGEILVDAATGEVLIDEEGVRRMTEDARRLAERCCTPTLSGRALAMCLVSPPWGLTCNCSFLG